MKTKVLIIIATLTVFGLISQTDVFSNKGSGHYIIMFRSKTIYKNW